MADKGSQMFGRADFFEPSLWRVVPSRSGRRWVLAILALYVVLVAALVPWARQPGPVIPTAVAIYTTGIVICSLASGLLLLAQPEARRAWYALAPACALLAFAMLAIAHLLSFPGAIMPGHAVLGGEQLGAYCFLATRLVFTALMLSAALAPSASTRRDHDYPVWWMPPLIAAAVIGVVSLGAIYEPLLPATVVGGRFSDFNLAVTAMTDLAALLAALLFWRHGLRSSQLQLCLALTMTALCGELVLSAAGGARFTWGWYGGRLSSVISSATILVFFLIRFATLQRQALAAAQTLARQATELRDEIDRRANAEARLLQVKKMETIGQLTGGVAHDFNNLMTVVLANLERLERKLGLCEPAIAGALADAQSGARRAGRLTKQLLAFSRRQTLLPQATSPNAIVVDAAALSRHLLPDTMKSVLRLGQGLPLVLADPNEAVTAVVNLIVNARDAMPDGGIITLRTEAVTVTSGTGPDLPAGAYLAIAVDDTGTGMSDEVLEHAFEPFFTTKPVGVGTGLGLSQVYGFARQSGGDATICSEPGKGSVVTIFLPVAKEAT